MRIITSDGAFPEDVFKQLATIGKEFLIQIIPLASGEDRERRFNAVDFSGILSSQELIKV